MREEDILLADLLEEACLTLDQFAAMCAIDREWIVERVDEGLLTAAPDESRWRFSSRHLRRARDLLLLERHFDASPELAALVADLLEEVRFLRSR